MPRNNPAPLGADIVRVNKGAARPLGEAARPPASEARIGITVRLTAAMHEQLRVLAFERRTSKQALLEGWAAQQLGEMTR